MKYKIGDKVTFTPSYSKDNKEKGIVKRLHSDKQAAWVVYKCGGDWENYQNYKGALTPFNNLTKGW